MTCFVALILGGLHKHKIRLQLFQNLCIQLWLVNMALLFMRAWCSSGAELTLMVSCWPKSYIGWSPQVLYRIIDLSIWNCGSKWIFRAGCLIFKSHHFNRLNMKDLLFYLLFFLILFCCSMINIRCEWSGTSFVLSVLCTSKRRRLHVKIFWKTLSRCVVQFNILFVAFS